MTILPSTTVHSKKFINQECIWHSTHFEKGQRFDGSDTSPEANRTRHGAKLAEKRISQYIHFVECHCKRQNIKVLTMTTCRQDRTEHGTTLDLTCKAM
jgi:hypothetical protein